MINDGASYYKFNEDDVSYIEIIELALKFKANDDNALKQQLGEAVYDYLDRENAFESFLQQVADKHGISLVGKSGLIQKTDALSSVLSKKHRGMISYIGQIRNAADHGADVDEGGKTWSISDEIAYTYPIIIANIIKNILRKENGKLNV